MFLDEFRFEGLPLSVAQEAEMKAVVERLAYLVSPVQLKCDRIRAYLTFRGVSWRERELLLKNADPKADPSEINYTFWLGEGGLQRWTE